MRFSSFAFVSSFAALFVASALVGACSSTQTTIPLDFGDAGTSTSPTDPNGSSGGSSGSSGSSGTNPGGSTCEKICARAESAKCSGQSSCVADCEADQKKIPDGCKAEADAAQECAATKATHFECNSKGKPIVKGDCDTEGNALVQCVLGGGKPDAGPKDCGNLSSGIAACDTCVNANCCAQAYACSNDAACADILDCMNTCTNSACYTKCENDHPAGKAKEQAFFACLDSKCNAQCQ